MALSKGPTIQAVVVNHNTSPWTELAMRSLFAQHPNLDITLTIYDNASTDDQVHLRAAAAELGVPIIQSGFTTETANNSHGDVLQQFVMTPSHDHCDYYLFLDADVCFTQARTVDRLHEALQDAEKAFGAGPLMSWDGETLTPVERRQMTENPGLYEARLHPCCALVRNTATFRSVVEEVGLSCAIYLWADDRQYLDTFELMTRVMRTHGLHHVVVDVLVLHAFGVSYPNAWQDTLPPKIARRDRWLEHFRAAAGGT
ncbi:glycosyltransferase family 2 protein [Actinopolymorpha pittospori]